MSAVTTVPGLHPDHLVYLQARGITQETIAANGLYSARPQDLPRLAGRLVPDGTSGLVIPYEGCEGFARVRLFPPILNADGQEQRFGQVQDSGVCVYIPAGVRRILANPEIPLNWAEGEVKGLAGTQAGRPTLALGGLWNWMRNGKPISDLDSIAHVDRDETLSPDSDVWVRPDLLCPVYAFGKELESRGARIRVVIIPPGPDGEKRGLDDHLLVMERDGVPGPEALARLKQIPLKDRVFSKTAEWWKGWVREKAVEPASDAMRLLEGVTQIRWLRPAQDFADGVLYVGLRAGEHIIFVMSDRKVLRGDQLPHGIRPDDRGFDLCRFSKEGVVGFLGGASVATHSLLKQLEAFFRRFILFRDPGLPRLIACWTAGTYLYQAFKVFPYLLIRSPRMRCGKTRLLDTISLLAFNASQPTTNPTEAQLFRGPARNGGTLLLDEVERLRGNREAFEGLLAVLNSGFQKGGVVTRLERQGDRFVEMTFETYVPRALAGISKLTETLEDRGIPVFMARKLKGERVARFSHRRLEAEAQQLRDQLYVWALTHAADAAELYEAGEFPDLQELDDRGQDLWEPLFTIALLADAEAEEADEAGDFASSLIKLAKDLSGVRDEGDTGTARLLRELTAIVSPQGTEEFTPTELLGFLQGRGFESLKSTKALAGVLNPLGLIARSTKVADGGRRKTRRLYLITRVNLKDLCQRYGDLEGGPTEVEERDLPFPPQNNP